MHILKYVFFIINK